MVHIRVPKRNENIRS